MKYQKKMKKKADPKEIGIPNINFSIDLTNEKDERNELFKQQRLERGFDDSELWNLDMTFVEFMLPRIKRFREVHCGYPGRLTDKKWNKILDEIIKGFELYKEFAYDVSLSPEQGKQINKAFKLFSQYIYDMWD